MNHRHRTLGALSAVVLLAVAAWWRFDASGAPVSPVAVPAVAADLAPGMAAIAEPSDAAATMAPSAARPASLVAEPPTDSVAVTATSDPAPEPPLETSVPGRSLAELERRARGGDAKAARDWVDALSQCARLVFSDSQQPPPRYLSHLDWTLVGERRNHRAEMLGALVDECRQLFPIGDMQAGSAQAQSLIEEALRLWAATGDSFGQLAASMMSLQWPPLAESWRQQQAWASAHLDPANPQTLVDLAQVFAYGSRFRYEEAWLLAACDLGYDCSAGGALQTSLCLRSELCSTGAYAEDLLQSLPPRRWQIIQRQRRELLDMLRRGDTRGVFDVPPPGG